VDLVLKHCQNIRRRVASLELAGERMSNKILLGLYLYALRAFSKMTLGLDEDAVVAEFSELEAGD
jgi:hypothetical protein